MSRRRRRLRENERELGLPNTPAFDRLLLRPRALAATLPEVGSLLDALAERIQPTWASDVSVTGPSSSRSGPRRAGIRATSTHSPTASVGASAEPAKAGSTARDVIPECAARAQRTEVLHALGRTGAGSRALNRKRKPASTQKC